MAGAGQRLRDLQKLLSGQRGADRRPPGKQTHVVKPPERRRLPQPERFGHFRYESEVGTDLLHIAAGLDLPRQFLAERGSSVARHELTDFVKFQQP